ncbi:hypothetical protein JXA85_08890 [Candidatus Woesearchaeota archaeon]|nr:hypothetical protein [Candidatus Woesearchaeota archaeon]
MKIVDSSCLICLFSEINRPFILLRWRKRGYRIVLTQEVHDELQVNKDTKKKVDPYVNKKEIVIESIIKEDELQVFRKRHPTLGIGESSVILTGIKLNKTGKRYYAILDDSNARKIAKKYGITFTGTYGLLKTLVEKGEIEQDIYEQCKKDMEKSNFRINFDKVQ